MSQKSWGRVKERLRAEVGEAVFGAWFACMNLEALEEGAARLSVPTPFLKGWIASRYAERVLACLQAQYPQIVRTEIVVRTAVLRTAYRQKPAIAAPVVARRNGSTNGHQNGHSLKAVLDPPEPIKGSEAEEAGADEPEAEGSEASETAEQEGQDSICPLEPKLVKIADIQRVVSRHYNVSREAILSSWRTANVVRPRQVAMYLAKVITQRSLPEIGRRFGGRDHTTVLHSVRKIERLIVSDTEFAEEVEGLGRQCMK